MSVEIVGVRHYSPACARLVAARIAALRPRHVLIEGPSDFNARIDELHLGHRLPIALYSYHAGIAGTHHCYAPFVEFSPEWAALVAARDCGSTARFIDLPYHARAWRDETQRYDVAAWRDRGRYARAQASLAARCGVDGDDALWDHLFEREATPEDFSKALSAYFHELRGDDAGDAADAAREAFMARHIAWAAAQGGDVVVVCGGWHRPALERLWSTLTPESTVPDLVPDASIERHGSYLVPYADRRLDALSGYGAGMPSPQYYRWLWRHGAERAAREAVRAIVARLRARRQTLSTASLVAAQQRIEGLARLRGHTQPLRCDVLDGLADALVDGALDAPLPWTARERLRADADPRLREALLALTGESEGQLAGDTPMPPLVADVARLLAQHDLEPGTRTRQFALDRRAQDDAARAVVLWRLRLVGISGFNLDGVEAPGAARGLGTDFHYLERWRVRRTDASLAELIEAGAWGPDLESAAHARLTERLHGVDAPAALADAVVDAVRAGYADLGERTLDALDGALVRSNDHGALALAGLRLAVLAEQGFWGESLAPRLAPLLASLLTRLTWLIEGIDGAQAPASTADIDAVRCIERLARTDLALASQTTAAAFALMQRRSIDERAPPALRGAAFGLLWRRGAVVAHDAVAAAARAMPTAVALGDFLSGLFALAREEVVASASLVAALDRSVSALGEEEFLVALPALRQAFAWFPPRERGELALVVAQLHGAGSSAARALTARLTTDVDTYARARDLERDVDATLARYGLAAPEAA
jgi:hypothetical protein